MPIRTLPSYPHNPFQSQTLKFLPAVMASMTDLMVKSLRDMEKELTCDICKELYADPKTLPCLHYYCKQCILMMAQFAGKGNPFPCPECRRVTTLHEGGKNLGTAFFVNRLKYLYMKHRMAVVEQVMSTAWNSIVASMRSDQNASGDNSNTAACDRELRRFVDEWVWETLLPSFAFDLPVRLGKPLKVWNGIMHPLSVVVNSKGEIIVAEEDGSILIFSKEDGQRVYIGGITSFQSIALDNEDNVFLIESSCGVIQRFSKTFDLFCGFGMQQFDGPGYIAIVIVGNEVVLTEQGNKGRMVVCDKEKELKFVRFITSKKPSKLMYLSSDPRGVIYVSDEGNSIHTFDIAGDHLHSFKLDPAVITGRTGPITAGVSGRFIYVADYSGSDIAMFTSDGIYVTRFGCYGGSCTDKEGFIYVCDPVNNRLCNY